MAKKGHKHQKRSRFRSANADKFVHGLPESPQTLSERIDGRRRTRVRNGKRADDPAKGGKRGEIARELRCHSTENQNRWNSQRPRMFDSFDRGVILFTKTSSLSYCFLAVFMIV